MADQRNGAPPAYIRLAVRDFLTAIPAWRELAPDNRRAAAELMVRVCQTAAALIAEEWESEAQVELQREVSKVREPQGESQRGSQREPQREQERKPPTASALAVETPVPPTTPQPAAQALNAGDEYSGVAAQRVAATTRAILNAVSFPTFVADLINGVFKAMSDNNVRQMQMFIELLNNVSASTEGFADLNMAPDRAREWLVEHFPASFEMEGGGEDDSSSDSGGWSIDDDVENVARVRLRPGASMPSEESLRAALGMEPSESIPTGDPDTSLVPLVRRRLARLRQETLATMVQLGLQRIVIDGGRIHASMRFHIDTRSAAQAEAGSMFSLQNQVRAQGRFGFGPWGVSAAIQNNISYVSSQRSTTTEEMNTDLDLNSSVELIFRTDQVPLDRLANARQTTQILTNTRNPEAEMRIAAEERRLRLGQQITTEEARAGRLASTLQPAQMRDLPVPDLPSPQPSGTQPRGTQPSGTQPSGTQPSGTQPSGTQPSGTQPSGTQPSGTQPSGTQPSGTQPSGTQPSGTQPSGTQPSGTQPSGTQPSGTQPSGTQPSGTQPSGTQVRRTPA